MSLDIGLHGRWIDSASPVVIICNVALLHTFNAPHISLLSRIKTSLLNLQRHLCSFLVYMQVAPQTIKSN